MRPVIGLTALAAGIAGLITLYVITVPPGNIQAVLLGLGIVLGWGSSVVQSEFGSSSAARRLIDSLTEDGELPPHGGDPNIQA